MDVRVLLRLEVNQAQGFQIEYAVLEGLELYLSIFARGRRQRPWMLISKTLLLDPFEITYPTWRPLDVWRSKSGDCPTARALNTTWNSSRRSRSERLTMNTSQTKGSAT